MRHQTRDGSLRKEPVMLVELRVAEQRLRAVWEVLDGASVTEVAR
jgi:hypothetical protein